MSISSNHEEHRTSNIEHRTSNGSPNGKLRCSVFDVHLPMSVLISHSPADTEALGESWGRQARRGLVIGLSGDLGAGKTQLVKGLARGLGITERVHSPSFSLVNIYAGGRLTLFHLDLYRLETREQILATGLAEYLEPTGVTVIEWAERWFGEVRSE